MTFVDSTFFVAVADGKDHWHEKAVDIPKELLEEATTSDYVISESVTIIGQRGGGRAGLDLYHFIQDNFRVVYADEELLKSSMDTFTEHDGTLSVADATSVEIMRQQGISRIISFDEDFDAVDRATRIH